MIFTSIHSDEYKYYPEALQKAVRFFKEHDITMMEPGRYEIQGDDIYVNVFDADTEPMADRRPEVHEKYADVQFLGAGEEDLGFVTDNGRYQLLEAKPEKDIAFYKPIENMCVVHSKPGCLCVFFPSDIHVPQCAAHTPMTVRKAVAKVSMKLL